MPWLEATSIECSSEAKRDELKKRFGEMKWLVMDVGGIGQPLGFEVGVI